MRPKLPHLKGLLAYAYCHSFATDALVDGVGIAQVADLLGYTRMHENGVSSLYAFEQMN